MPSRSSSAHAKVLERRRRVLELKIAHASWQMIAEQISTQFDMPKYTRSDAYNDWKRLNEEFIRQPLDEYRDMEIAACDTMQVAIWNKVLRGELDAIETVLKIQDKRAKFQGTYAPTKIAGPDGGPLQVDMFVRGVLAAMVNAVDSLNLPADQRAAMLDKLGEDVLTIEGSIGEEQK